LTGLGNLCLLIFQIAFIATTLCFFLTLALLEVANGGGMCGQLTLDTADAARRRFERADCCNPSSFVDEAMPTSWWPASGVYEPPQTSGGQRSRR